MPSALRALPHLAEGSSTHGEDTDGQGVELVRDPIASDADVSDAVHSALIGGAPRQRACRARTASACARLSSTLTLCGGGALLCTLMLAAFDFPAGSWWAAGVYSTMWLLALLLACSAGAAACCGLRTCLAPRHPRVAWWVPPTLLLTALALAAIPSPAQRKLLSSVDLVISSILGIVGVDPDLPRGYCDAMGVSQQRAHGAGAGQGVGPGRRLANLADPPWWAAWGATADAAASALVDDMEEGELHRLVQGVGWSGWNLRRGYHVGTIYGIPRLGVPPIQMHDASQGFRTIGAATQADAAQACRRVPRCAEMRAEI